MLSSSKQSYQQQDKEFTKLAKHLPAQVNTIITKEFMTKQSRLWQSHLTKIADYLVSGPGSWWKWREDGSVEFFDSNQEEETKAAGPKLGHFRSSTIKDVFTGLNNAWETCIKTPEDLPVNKLCDAEESGSTADKNLMKHQI